MGGENGGSSESGGGGGGGGGLLVLWVWVCGTKEDLGAARRGRGRAEGRISGKGGAG